MFWNIQDGHHPIILTERQEHSDLLTGLIKDKCDNVFVLSGKDKAKETLNKSHHKIVCTSCLHIFRQPAQKILVMRQHYCGLFVQPDKKSDGAICTNDLISVSLEN